MRVTALSLGERVADEGGRVRGLLIIMIESAKFAFRPCAPFPCPDLG